MCGTEGLNCDENVHYDNPTHIRNSLIGGPDLGGEEEGEKDKPDNLDNPDNPDSPDKPSEVKATSDQKGVSDPSSVKTGDVLNDTGGYNDEFDDDFDDDEDQDNNPNHPSQKASSNPSNPSKPSKPSGGFHPYNPLDNATERLRKALNLNQGFKPSSSSSSSSSSKQVLSLLSDDEGSESSPDWKVLPGDRELYGHYTQNQHKQPLKKPARSNNPMNPFNPNGQEVSI